MYDWMGDMRMPDMSNEYVGQKNAEQEVAAEAKQKDAGQNDTAGQKDAHCTREKDGGKKDGCRTEGRRIEEY